MTKTEMIQEIFSVLQSAGAHISKNDTEEVVNATFDVIKNTLAQEQEIRLVGFGTFSVRERSAKSARNPKTGEIIAVAATKTPHFKPGKNLKEAVNKIPLSKKD